MKFNRLTFTLTLMLLATIVANAQQRRNVTSGYNKIVYEYESVDIRPQFPGGETGLINFINETREYPYNAYRDHIQGRVLCSFIVGTDGRVSDVRVIRSAGDESLNREAIRVISKMPKWSVGKVADHAVPVRVVLPIAFRL